MSGRWDHLSDRQLREREYERRGLTKLVCCSCGYDGAWISPDVAECSDLIHEFLCEKCYRRMSL